MKSLEEPTIEGKEIKKQKKSSKHLKTPLWPPTGNMMPPGGERFKVRTFESPPKKNFNFTWLQNI